MAFKSYTMPAKWPDLLKDSEWKKVQSKFSFKTGLGEALRAAEAAFGRIDMAFFNKLGDRKTIIKGGEAEQGAIEGKRATILQLINQLSKIISIAATIGKKKGGKDKEAAYAAAVEAEANKMSVLLVDIRAYAPHNLNTFIAEYSAKKQGLLREIAEAQDGRNRTRAIVSAFEKKTAGFLASIQKLTKADAEFLPHLKVEIRVIQKKYEDMIHAAMSTGGRSDKVDAGRVKPFLSEPDVEKAYKAYLKFDDIPVITKKIKDNLREIDAHYIKLKASVGQNESKLFKLYEKSIKAFKDISNMGDMPEESGNTLERLPPKVREQRLVLHRQWENNIKSMASALATINKVRKNIPMMGVEDVEAFKKLDAERIECDRYLARCIETFKKNDAIFKKLK